MASEFLSEAYSKYIEPLLNFGWIYMNNEGFLVERENKTILKFINNNYSGKPDENQYTFPVIPISDGHYIRIKDNPEIEIFNPFYNMKHMTMVLLEFKRGLINTHLSENTGSDDTPIYILEQYIEFYNRTLKDGAIEAGIVNNENKENPIVLYTYTARDLIEAMWGVCVTAFNAVDRKHADYFYTIEKSWGKALRLVNKWNTMRKEIITHIREENKENTEFNAFDFSGTEDHRIREYGPQTTVPFNGMNSYLTSLFRPYEFSNPLPNMLPMPPPIAPPEPVFPGGLHYRRIDNEVKKIEFSPEEVKEPVNMDELQTIPGKKLTDFTIENIEAQKIEDAAPLKEPEPQKKPSFFKPAQQPMRQLQPFQQYPQYPLYQQPPMGMGRPGMGMPGMSPMGYPPQQMMYSPQPNRPFDSNQIDFISYDRPDPFYFYHNDEPF
jgi:hypothetical protein